MKRGGANVLQCTWARAPTAETLTRHLFRSLSLLWISPPFPGGKGAGGMGAARPLLWARRPVLRLARSTCAGASSARVLPRAFLFEAF